MIKIMFVLIMQYIFNRWYGPRSGNSEPLCCWVQLCCTKTWGGAAVLFARFLALGCRFVDVAFQIPFGKEFWAVYFCDSFWQGIQGCVSFCNSFWQGILGWAFLLIPFVKEFPGPRGHVPILLSRINLELLLQEVFHCLIQ